jgi:hypothetical protein
MTRKPILTVEAANEMAKNTTGLDFEAFTDWVDYRKATGKPIKPAMYPWLISRMVKMGNRQKEAVDHSSGNGYQGLFLPSGRAPKHSGLKATLEDFK